MIELELTDAVQQWLSADPASRSIEEGARLLLRINRNRVLYTNILASPARGEALLEYHLEKILKVRLIEKTHEQVQEMMKQVAAIAEERGIERPDSTKRTDQQLGKRADHDSLPQEIQQLWVRNAELRRQMRDAHAKVRVITQLNSSCPDNDRFPLAKIIIDCDKEYRRNWRAYDNYKPGEPVESQLPAADERAPSRKSVSYIHILLANYARSKSEATAQRIKDTYAKIEAPTEHLIRKMQDAGLL